MCVNPLFVLYARCSCAPSKLLIVSDAINRFGFPLSFRVVLAYITRDYDVGITRADLRNCSGGGVVTMVVESSLINVGYKGCVESDQ